MQTMQIAAAVLYKIEFKPKLFGMGEKVSQQNKWLVINYMIFAQRFIYV